MAKTIDREKHSAARTSNTVRGPQDVEETEPVDDAQAGAAGADADPDELLEAEPEADEEALAVAPVSEDRFVTRTSAAGVQAPAALLKNPLTRGLTEAYIELRKVTWPTRRDAWNMTIVTIVVSAIMSGLLALADFGLGHLLSYLVSIGLGK
ncbi:MAG TPA: preprotein translocase subunit SecE [Ktedonobacterales bacterium]